MELTATPSVNDLRGRAIAAITARLGQLDLTPLAIYWIDDVPDAALPFLAWQFDVYPNPVWKALTPGDESGFDESSAGGSDFDSDSEPSGGFDATVFEIAGSASGASERFEPLRALIKTAIQLHRYRGTPFAIVDSLNTLGYLDATLLEGQSSWGGDEYPSDQGWAVFRVNIPVNPPDVPTSDELESILAVVKWVKNARSWLDGIWMILPPISDGPILIADSAGVGDSVHVEDGLISIALSPYVEMTAATPDHSGRWQHAGFDYSDEPIGVVDGAIVINGQAEEGNE